MNNFETPPRILFPHIAKTGGTALLYHFRTNWEQDKIFVYGRHNRCQLFFNGEYQLEEQNPQDRAKYRVVQGHGVDEELISILGDPNIKLMIVLREPVSLTRSRFNQRMIGYQRHSLEITQSSFMAELAIDPITNKLLRQFPSFVDESATGDVEKAISILRKFDYVLTTEQMNAQLQSMFIRYDLPTKLERRRVAEGKTPLEVSDDDIHAITSKDAVLHRTFNKIVENDGTHHNAHGFDHSGKAEAVQNIVDQIEEHPDDVRIKCYRALANGLCTELRAEAALALIEEAPEVIPVLEKQEFKAFLETAWAKRVGKGLNKKAKNRSAQLMKHTLIKHRRVLKQRA